MASLRTASSINQIQGIATAYNISACVTGDTLKVATPVLQWIPVNQTTTDAISATYSSTTQLFTITVANTPDVSIIVFH
jgi:hypothetical protein